MLRHDISAGHPIEMLVTYTYAHTHTRTHTHTDLRDLTCVCVCIPEWSVLSVFLSLSLHICTSSSSGALIVANRPIYRDIVHGRSINSIRPTPLTLRTLPALEIMPMLLIGPDK